MATTRLLLSQLRRSTRSLSQAPLYNLLKAPQPPPSLSSLSHYSYFQQLQQSLLASHSFYSASAEDDDSLSVGDDSFTVGDSVPLPAEIGNFTDGVIGISGGEVPILHVRALISLLDAYHDLSGFPWWVVIASSTLAFRAALLPVIILQLTKLKRIGELFPKLPPPFPPPLSGKSFINQFSLFRRERKLIGCPSFLWFLASVSIQIPCFLLGMTSIARMSLHGHPGFDCGGTLWFQNLTETPHGVLSPIFPILIAGLHYANVQVSFRTSSLSKENGLFGLLAKYYKLYLNLLPLPLFVIGFCIPQGSLVYWVTNSSLTLIQQLFLQHPAVRAKMGFPDKDASTKATKSEETYIPERHLDLPSKQRQISVKDLSPKELVALSVKLLSKGQKEKAISFLQLALDKDPDYVHALVLMGQTLLQKELLPEAVEYLERSISKLFCAGHSTEVEDVDLLILASQWAGVACVRQGKMAEGIVHLERIGNLKEPEDVKSKAHYYEGLVLLSSALYNIGRKAEAAKLLRLAAAYNPSYNELLQQCENDEDDLASDLNSSRRGDY